MLLFTLGMFYMTTNFPNYHGSRSIHEVRISALNFGQMTQVYRILIGLYFLYRATGRLPPGWPEVEVLPMLD